MDQMPTDILDRRIAPLSESDQEALSFKEVKEELDKTKKSIDKVEQELDDIKKEICSLQEQPITTRDNETKIKKLEDKERQLREEKRELGDKEMFYLKQEADLKTPNIEITKIKELISPLVPQSGESRAIRTKPRRQRKSIQTSFDNSSIQANNTTEGLPSRFYCKREAFLARLIKDVVNYRRVLISAPPQSGKTSTAELIFRHGSQLQPTNARLRFEFISFATYDTTSPIDEFVDKYIDLNEILYDKRVVLVIDSAHKVYSHSVWWQKFKSEAGYDKCAILVFAAYGSKQSGTAQSPNIFQLLLNFAHLAFSRDEFNECIQLYRTSGGSAHVLTDPVVDQIAFSVKHQLNSDTDTEKYHPGLLISCIELIVNRCKSEEEALLFIAGCGIIRYLEARCLVVFEDILVGIRSEKERAHRRIEAPSLNDQDIARMLRDCIYKLIVNQKVAPNDTPGYSYCQQLLVKYCYCYQDDQGRYVTTCPLIRAHLIKFMIRPDSKGNYEFDTGDDALRAFIIEAFDKFDRKTLDQSFSRKEKGAKLYDISFLCEFYSAAKYLYGGMILVDVGRYLGSSDGKLDMYISGDKNFGIEFLVNGDGLKAHVDRFTYGLYSKMIQMRDYIIVDIYIEELTDNLHQVDKRCYSKYLAVLFSQNFSKIDFFICN